MRNAAHTITREPLPGTRRSHHYHVRRFKDRVYSKHVFKKVVLKEKELSMVFYIKAYFTSHGKNALTYYATMNTPASLVQN